MSRPVATLEFGGTRRAYTLAQLEALRGVPVDRVPTAHQTVPRHVAPPIVAAIRKATEDALRAARGDVTYAALALGVSRRTLYYNCERYGIAPATFRETPCSDD